MAAPVCAGLAGGTAAASALIGHLSALTVPTWFGFESTTTSGMIAFASGVLFTLAWLFSPTEGVLVKLWRQRNSDWLDEIPEEMIP